MSDEDVIYCICRSTDISRFMIGCDKCDEWFHGDCIGLQEESANDIELYFCKFCRRKNPDLKIVYKRGEKEKKEKSHKHKHKEKDRHRDREKERERPDKYEKQNSKTYGGEFEDFLKQIKTDKTTIQKHKEREANKKLASSKDKKSRRCGSCEGCMRIEDCGKCVYCKDMRKFGGTNTLKRKCRTRTCSVFQSSSKEKPSQQHESPPSPKAKAKLSPPKPRSFSPTPKVKPSPPSPKPRAVSPPPKARAASPLRALVPSLPPSFRIPKREAPKPEPVVDIVKSEDDADILSSDEGVYKSEEEAPVESPFIPSTVKQQVDEGLADIQREQQRQQQKQQQQRQQQQQLQRQLQQRQQQDRQEQRMEVDAEESESDSDWAGPTPAKRGKKRATKKVRKKGKNQKRTNTKRPAYKKKEVYSYEEYTPYALTFPSYNTQNSYTTEISGDEPRQCYGPNCVEPARQGSKYCNDDCGLKLATSRIFEILPARIQNWHSSPCQAEEADKVSLEKVRQDQLKAKQKLEDLDRKQKQLGEFINNVKQYDIAEAVDSQDEETDSEMQTIFCVTCGHEVGQKTALKHMEKCFQKFEGLTAFGSTYPSRIEGNIFCDKYTPSSGIYCKRLKVLCPEHSKEPKASLEEVCGCPLQTKQFKDTGEVCRNAKRKCNKHPCWERMRRAEIDLERLRQWVKLDDLFDKERSIRVAMSNRAGVLSLMLHQTIDHDSLKPIMKTAN